MKLKIGNQVIETSEIWIDDVIFIEDQDTSKEERSYYIGGKIPPATFKKKINIKEEENWEFSFH